MRPMRPAGASRRDSCRAEEQPSFKRSLRKLSEELRRRVEEAVDQLKADPHLGKPLKDRQVQDSVPAPTVPLNADTGKP